MPAEGTGSDPRRRTTPARWRVLGHPDGMLVYQVRCIVEDHGWSDTVDDNRYKVTLGRSGAYHHRLNGRVMVVDPTSVVITRPGDEQAAAHPYGCGDSYTCLEIDRDVLAGRPDAARWLDRSGWDGHSDASLDLAHRLLVAECRRGLDRFEMAERLHRFLGRLLTHSALAAGGPDAGPPHPGGPGPGGSPAGPAAQAARSGRRLTADPRTFLQERGPT